MVYRGIVNFEILNNGVVVGHLTTHNSGTARLQWLFAKALSGGNVGDGIPGYIDVTINNTSILKAMVPITGLSFYNKIGSEDKWHTRLNAIITNQDLMSGITTASLSNCTFRLYDKNQTFELANTTLTGTDVFQNQDGMQLNLNWQLYIDIGDN